MMRYDFHIARTAYIGCESQPVSHDPLRGSSETKKGRRPGGGRRPECLSASITASQSLFGTAPVGEANHGRSGWRGCRIGGNNHRAERTLAQAEDEPHRGVDGEREGDTSPETRPVITH